VKPNLQNTHQISPKTVSRGPRESAYHKDAHPHFLMPTDTRKQLAFSKTQVALSTNLPRQKRLSLLSTMNSVKPS